MGGNLFKLGRVSKTRYKEIENSLKPYLDAKLENHYRIPKYYADKADFGDLDILVSSAAVKSNWQDLKKAIASDLRLNQFQNQGRVFSTVYQNFQVDFFLIQKKYFESTYNFLCYNDIGNLIGKIFRKFNLKYGERGLEYVFRREDNHYVKDIPVSQDFEKMYAFIGLDYARWEKGFDNREEMFEWVIASPYFSVQPYQKLSRSMEKRQRERATIQRFLQFLETYHIEKTYQYKENRDDYIPMIADYFPEADLITKIEAEKEREAFLKVIKAKFNGKIVMELLPHLKGKELGGFIKMFKESVDDFEEVIYHTTPNEVKRMILNFYTKKGE